MELISSYPNHYRVPLSHKKIGDIYLQSDDMKSAKDKYNFVVREYQIILPFLSLAVIEKYGIITIF